MCQVVGMGQSVCRKRLCSSTWHQQNHRSNGWERVRCSNRGPKERRHVCEDVTGATCLTLESSSIGSCDEARQKINQAWFTAPAFASIFAKHRQFDVSEVMGSTHCVHFETLRRARNRLDVVASWVCQQWWREILASSTSIFLYPDRSPRSRGEDMFASSFEIWDQRLPWSRELTPVLSLERHMLDARSKTFFFFSKFGSGCICRQRQ